MSSPSMRDEAARWGWIAACPAVQRPRASVWVPAADLRQAYSWLECLLCIDGDGLRPYDGLAYYDALAIPSSGFQLLGPARMAYIASVLPRGLALAAQDLTDELALEHPRDEAGIEAELREIGWSNVSVQILDNVALIRARKRASD